jgi:hypothetical protein
MMRASSDATATSPMHVLHLKSSIEDDFELSEDIIFHRLPMEKTLGSL